MSRKQGVRNGHGVRVPVSARTHVCSWRGEAWTEGEQRGRGMDLEPCQVEMERWSMLTCDSKVKWTSLPRCEATAQLIKAPNKTSFLILLFPLLITSKSIKRKHWDQLTSLPLYHHQLSPAANISLLEESNSIRTGLLELIYFRVSLLQWRQSNL